MEAQLLSNNISKNVLKGDLKFLVDSIEYCGLDFRLLPFQKLNKNDFNKKYWKKISKNTEDHIDIIGAYHIKSTGYGGYIKTNNITQIQDKLVMNDDYEFNDEAHIIYKLDNGYWVYTHIYSAYSGFTPWGIDNMISYTSKDLDELITYGIARKHWKLLEIKEY